MPASLTTTLLAASAIATAYSDELSGVLLCLAVIWQLVIMGLQGDAA